MEIIKENPDMMKSVVKMAKGCNHMEYYGMIVMRDGFNYCRSCIYDLWEREGLEAAKRKADLEAAKYGCEPDYKHLKYWRRDPKEDLVFPLYEDGKNYYNEGADK